MHPIDTDGAPSIAIGGRLWPVPLLAARQNKIIDPLILRLLPIFAEWPKDRAAALARLGPPEYEALLDIAFHAIRRAYPNLTREEFLDLPVTLPELVAAFGIVAQQTGIFTRSEEEETGAGEAGAGNAPTGTLSSPGSAP